MATHLPQNQFNSADVPTVDEAAASRSPPLPDAAAALSVSDDDGFSSLPSGESDPSVMLDSALSGTEAAVVNGSPTTAAASDIMHLEHNAITQAIEVRPHNELEQLIGVAGKKRPPALPREVIPIPEIWREAANYLCRHDSRFAPDEHAMWDAMVDTDAPRLRADDPVWSDAAPMFLRRVW